MRGGIHVCRYLASSAAAPRHYILCLYYTAHGACLAQTVAESVAFESTLPFMALTTSSLLEPLAISSRPDSAYSLKLAVLPFLLGPR